MTNQEQIKIKKAIIRTGVGVIALLAVTLNQSFAEDTAPATTPTTNAPVATTIDDILISDISNKDGYVLQSKGVALSATDTKKIYVTVQLGHAVQGQKVIATLNYPGNSGDDIGPVVATTDMSGDTMTAFSFTTTPMPWPKGTYTVDVSIANGISKTAKFDMQ